MPSLNGINCSKLFLFEVVLISETLEYAGMRGSRIWHATGVFKVSFLKDLIKAIRGTFLSAIFMKVPLMGEALKTPM